jgi:O-antigen ligase
MKKVFFYKEIILYLILLFPATILTGPALPEIFKFLIIIFFFLSVLEEKKKILFNIPSVIFYIFILILLLSALYSDYKINYSSTIFYIRHWWLVLAIIYILGENRFYKKFSKVLIFIFLFSVFDGLFQYIVGKDIFFNEPKDPNIITGPFNDKRLGSYIARLLPLYLIFFSEIDNKKKYLNLFFFSHLLIIFTVLLTRERVAIFFTIFIIFFYYLINLNLKNFIRVCIVLLLITLALIFHHPFKENYITNTYKQIYTGNYFWSKTHLTYGITSYDIFKKNIFLGAGPNSYKFECQNTPNIKLENKCNTHPHNFLFQLMAELGLLGLCFYLSVYFFFLYLLIKKITEKYLYKTNTNTDLLLLITILFNFNPIFPSGNFFSSWLNNLLYIPIAIFLIKKKYIKI